MTQETFNQQDRRHASLGKYLSVVYYAVKPRGIRFISRRKKQQARDSEESTVPARMKSFVIIDDDQDFLDSLTEQLQEYEFDVHQAHDYSGFQALLDTQTPDIILVDYYIAEHNGLDIVRELTQNPHLIDTSIVLMSGHAGARSLAEHHKISFIEKPFSIAELLDLLKTIEDRRRGPTEDGWGQDAQKRGGKNRRQRASRLFGTTLFSDLKTLFVANPD